MGWKTIKVSDHDAVAAVQFLICHKELTLTKSLTGGVEAEERSTRV